MSVSLVTQSRATSVVELLWFNVAWASLVLANQTLPWLGASLVLGTLLFREIRSQFASVLLIALLGCSIDQLLTTVGLFRFEPSGAPGYALIPYWLVGLWFCFSATLHSSMKWLSYWI